MPNPDPAMPTAQTLPPNQPPASSAGFATKLLAVLLVLLIITIGYILLRPAPKTSGPAAATTAPAAVSITATGFSPATVSVRRGQAVTWTNTDANPHGITSSVSGSSSFKSPQNLSQDDTYSFIFNASGTYTYHDTLNPTTLSGTVVVK